MHAVLRRLDDDFCDPAELRADSALGVPGLLRAVRAGRVVLGNALGSGVIESAAWLGFLPSICEWLLGETLQLPSVATWWCGERPALEEVLDGSGSLGHQADVPESKVRAGVRPRSQSRRAGQVDPSLACAPVCLRGSRAPRTIADASVAWQRPRGSCFIAARLCDRRARRISGDSWRHGAHRVRCLCRCRFDSARRRQQRRLGVGHE